ncbi:MAG: GNAT family N-acetyltransferase [Ignavibacteriales bacterium]|nr:GNAT family N-acetyltransferase [Ignavibacteriales bacterium]
MDNAIFNQALNTKRFTLRPLQAADDTAIFLMRSDPENAVYLDRPLAQDIGQARDFIAKISGSEQKGGVFYRVIEIKENKTIAGTICLWNFDHGKQAAEIGFELLPLHKGKGIMQEVIPAVISFGFQKLGLRQITAEAGAGNIKSISLLERFGFTETQPEAVPTAQNATDVTRNFFLNNPANLLA